MDELRDAVTGRAAGLVLGVLVIQLAFVFSYVGAFHRPTPHRVPIVVVAPDSLAQAVTKRLNALPGAPLAARASSQVPAALTRLRRDQTDGVLALDQGGQTDTLYVAGGG